MAKILIPTPLRPYTDKQDAVDASGTTVGWWPLADAAPSDVNQQATLDQRAQGLLALQGVAEGDTYTAPESYPGDLPETEYQPPRQGRGGRTRRGVPRPRSGSRQARPPCVGYVAGGLFTFRILDPCLADWNNAVPHCGTRS